MLSHAQACQHSDSQTAYSPARWCPSASEAFKRFLARVKTAGVFKGAVEGTPEYDAVYKVVVQKFKARQQQKVRA